jgi:hypothetical protein
MGFPRRKMLWGKQPDYFNQVVSNSLKWTQVDSMLACLHFRDSAVLDNNGFCKVKYISEGSCN